MPSRRHELLARLVPKLRKSRELDSPDAERARLEKWHATLDRGFPTTAVPLFDRRYAVVREELLPTPPGRLPGVHPHPARPAADPDRRLPARRRVRRADRPLPGAVRRPAGLGLDARVVMPDYPLTPEHTWRRRARADRRAGRSGCSSPRRRRGAGRRLGRRRPRPRGRADRSATAAARSRPPAADLALGRPDHEHAGDPRGHQDRPVAVHRQDAGLRRVVGRLARRPRPARGLARRSATSPGCRRR